MLQLAIYTLCVLHTALIACSLFSIIVIIVIIVI